MQGRADELRGVVEGLASGSPGHREQARQIGQALRGSGATFGFPEISDAAAMVESARDTDLLRRVEGLIAHLRSFTIEAEGGAGFVEAAPEWLSRAVDGTESPTAEAGAGGPEAGARDWASVAKGAGVDLDELTRRAAEYLGVGVADFGQRGTSALRLVPEAFVSSRLLTPRTEET